MKIFIRRESEKMYQILIVMLAFFIVVLLYSAMARKFTKSKIIFFLPTIVAVLSYGVVLYWHVTTPEKGIQGLTTYFAAIFAVVVIGTNIISFYAFSPLKRQIK